MIRLALAIGAGCYCVKNNTIIQVVSVYWPCYSQGLLSTYQQQLQHHDHQLPICPHMRWLAAGELLMVARDFNDDRSQTAFKCRFQHLGLVDALATLHGQLTLPTHNCSTFLIDAVYILPGLMSGVTGGYLAFGDRLLSYHWGLWVDLNVDILFGSSNHAIWWNTPGS